MTRPHLFKHAFITLILVGVLNFIATRLYLYWTTQYFDSLVHFTAGISVGFATLWIVSRSQPSWTTIEIFRVAFFGTLAIGLLWEAYELMFGITSILDGVHYVTDTLFDLVMDVLGSVVAAFYSMGLATTTPSTEQIK